VRSVDACSLSLSFIPIPSITSLLRQARRGTFCACSLQSLSEKRRKKEEYVAQRKERKGKEALSLLQISTDQTRSFAGASLASNAG